jgi:TolA-binding protein
VTGCANAETAQLQQRVKALESEVASLRNSQGRLEDQVAGVRARQSAAPTGGSTQEGRVADSGRLLQVVRVVPAEAAAGSPGDAGASEAPVTAPSAAPSAGPEKPRPIIRGTGERIEGRYIEEPTSSWAPKGDEQDTGRSS